MDEYTKMMLAAVRIIPRAPRFLRNLLFGGRSAIFSDTAKCTVDMYKGGRKLAPIVARRIGGKVVEKTAWDSTDFTTPLVAPRDIVTEEDLEKRLPGEPDYNGMGIQDRRAAYLALKVDEFTQMHDRLEEYMVAQQLFTGKLTLTGDGYADELDLSFTNTYTADPDWADATAKPIDDLAAWKLDVGSHGVMPDTCVMPADVYAAFMASASVQAEYDKRNILPGTLQPQMTANGEVVSVGYIPRIDMWLYVYSATYDLNGTATAYVPAKKLVIFPSAERNSYQMYYGACYDAVKKASFRVDRYPRFFEDPKSNAEYFELQSRPLPILRDVDSWGVATVLE
jgi:hypothetical protein